MRYRLAISHACFWAFALLVQSANAQPLDPIATDRPGNGNAPTTVPLGFVQLESSVSYAKVHGAPAALRTLSAPTAVRFGLLEGFELRVGTSLVGLHIEGNQQKSRATDTSLGAKLQLLDNHGLVPTLGAVVDVWLPTGSGPFTEDAVVPDGRLAATWSLPAGFGVLLNVGVDLPDDAEGRHLRLIYVTNFNYTLPVLAESVNVFVESYGRLAPARDDADIVQIDLGVAWLLRPDAQLDLFSQHALSDAAPDLQIACGFSLRI